MKYKLLKRKQELEKHSRSVLERIILKRVKVKVKKVKSVYSFRHLYNNCTDQKE